MSTTASSAIEIDGVTKRYGDFTAVGNISVSVPRGVVYGFLGPNGAGKTTTLRMVNDIIAPDEGTIELLGQYAPGPSAVGHVGYLPEERGLYPKMQVLELLQFFGELRGMTGKDAAHKGCEWLERLEIGEWAHKKVQDLSKGMQQKVQFVTAVIHEPELLILDEPWSGLDPINAEVLRDIVVEQKEQGHTIVFSTHLMEQAEKICDHVFIIARGRRVLDGELAAIKREAAGDRLVALSFKEGGDAGGGGNAGAAAESILADGDLIAERRDRGDHVQVELANGASSDQLLRRLVEAGARLRRFELVEPSLHQIFVDRVGAEEAMGGPRGE